MVTHYRTAGHPACGRHGKNLIATSELNRVKCRSCRNTEAFKAARKDQRNAARRARRANTHPTGNDWRSAWIERLSALPGRQRLPRGFYGQGFV